MEIRPQPSTEPGGGSTLEQLWRAPGDDVAVIPGTENHEPGNVRVSFLVADAQGQAVTLPTARVWVANALDARPFLETDREARADRGARWRRGRRDAHLRRQREAAARRQVLDARRAGGRQHQGAGARERRRQEGGRTSRRRRPRNCVEHADARIDGRRHLEADDSHPARRIAPALFRCRLVAGERAVRRDVRDAQVLREQDVRAGRRRRGGGAATPRRRRASASSTWRCTRATTRRRASISG